MLEKDFVPPQESLEVKELGFDEPCMGYRDGNGHLMIKSTPHCVISSPTFSQTFRFFRKKGYDIKIEKESEGLYFGFYWTGAAWIIVGEGSYEKAELACLRKLIEIVKNK